jgi:hypothetical protein
MIAVCSPKAFYSSVVWKQRPCFIKLTKGGKIYVHVWVMWVLEDERLLFSVSLSFLKKVYAKGANFN